MGVICCDEEKNKRKKKNVGKENKNDLFINKLGEEKTKEYLESLYKSYYSAKTYFCENEFKEKEVDAINKLRDITSAQELLKNGKCEMIDIDKLPKQITSEYITDYNEEERKKKIEEIIECLNKEKELAEIEMEKKIEQLKSNIKNINKLNINKFKEDSKEILDKIKIKKENISKEIERVKETLKSEYIPVPDYIMKSVEYQMEIIDEDIPENKMRINVSNLTYSKSNPLIILNLNVNDNTILKKEIKGKKNSDINETFDWNIKEYNNKSLIRGKIEIILERTYMIKDDKIKGISEIQLRRLSDSSLIEENCKIKMNSGKADENIDISIKIRAPFFQKQYKTNYRDAIEIKKIYPKYITEEEKEKENDNNCSDNEYSLDKMLEEINKNTKK